LAGSLTRSIKNTSCRDTAGVIVRRRVGIGTRCWKLASRETEGIASLQSQAKIQNRRDRPNLAKKGCESDPVGVAVTTRTCGSVKTCAGAICIR